ncbi:pilus assembly PilX N-terminal domain-containing protein [Candidatus Saccharibacteria bacterium]|nr:pilus assembly PilX N-terminal domain-containing protein [Candidatus Saccharibacteria bacterium]
MRTLSTGNRISSFWSSKKQDFNRDERGLVSFMVTLIMMLVISLIVIGFTQAANRNRRQTLDRQLSAQAFYAAESGVNDVVKTIRTNINAGTPVASQSSCNGSDYPTTGSLSPDGSVKYTCVLVKTTVPDVRTTASTQSSSVVHLKLSQEDGSNLPPTASVDLSFTWSVANSASPDPANCSTAGIFKKNDAANTCGYGLLRVDLMQANGGFSGAQDLASNTMTFYMQPVSSGGGSGGVSSFTGATKGVVVPAVCSDASQTCKGTIVLSASALTPLDYYARISTLYRDTPSVVVDAVNASGTDAWFTDSQARIDVTGKAQDVLRRVQVRVPLQQTGTTNLPLGSLQSSGDVCKRFSVYSGVTAINSCP